MDLFGHIQKNLESWRGGGVKKIAIDCITLTSWQEMGNRVVPTSGTPLDLP